MAASLKSLIVRNPSSNRLFQVEKDPTPGQEQSVVTLRRLDREVREQARICRPRSEVMTWVVLEERAMAYGELLAAAHAVLRAWNNLHPGVGSKPTKSELAASLQNLAEAVGPDPDQEVMGV